MIKIQLRYIRILLSTQGINRVMRNIILRHLDILAPRCNDFLIVRIRMHAARMHAHHNSDDAHTQDNIGSVALGIHFTRYNSFSSVTIVYNNSTITITMSRRGSDDESDTEGESELKRLREEVMSLRAEKGVKLSILTRATMGTVSVIHTIVYVQFFCVPMYVFVCAHKQVLKTC